ncbi:hypothetical protein DsansV1_C07g0076031 [Dioscorea sansibarensis]
MGSREEKLTLKLLIDKESKRVVFAESDKDFVDILLSFLTLPLGTVIRLLDKHSSLGCMDALYENVEKLDLKCLQTEACVSMLLCPRSVAERHCKDLKIKVDNLNPKRLFLCPKWDCVARVHKLCSSVADARCPCGSPMDKFALLWRKEGSGDGGFVRGDRARFLVSDDLHVSLASIASSFSLLQDFGVQNASLLQEREVSVGRPEILRLLKACLISKTPLSNVFMGLELQPFKHQEAYRSIGKKEEAKTSTTTRSKTMSANILQSKHSGEVKYAEIGEDMVDLLFSFLTFPLGTIVKLLSQDSSLGCMSNLYSSVLTGDSFILKDHKKKLLNPKLAPHFKCSNQLLKVKESSTRRFCVDSCEHCFENSIKCSHRQEKVYVGEINPKSASSASGFGGGFMKESQRFMVTDKLDIVPVSPSSSVGIVNSLMIPLTKLEMKEITFGEDEALELLRSCLTSKDFSLMPSIRKNPLLEMWKSFF